MHDSIQIFIVSYKHQPIPNKIFSFPAKDSSITAIVSQITLRTALSNHLKLLYLIMHTLRLLRKPSRTILSCNLLSVYVQHCLFVSQFVASILPHGLPTGSKSTHTGIRCVLWTIRLQTDGWHLLWSLKLCITRAEVFNTGISNCLGRPSNTKVMLNSISRRPVTFNYKLTFRRSLWSQIRHWLQMK